MDRIRVAAYRSNLSVGRSDLVLHDCKQISLPHKYYFKRAIDVPAACGPTSTLAIRVSTIVWTAPSAMLVPALKTYKVVACNGVCSLGALRRERV
jgi:hypothetical protein